LPNLAPIPPAIDYTNRDYASFRQAMLDLAAFRLPEWTDRSEADLGVLMVEQFAYLGDILAYYQDRIASESFLTTATERRSILYLLRLIGYQLNPPVAAHAELQLIFNPAPAGAPTTTTIPSGAQFATQGSPALTYEYLGPDIPVDLAASLSYGPLQVQHSATVIGEVLGSSTGVANLRFALSKSPVIPDSVVVTVDEGAGPVTWNRRENLLAYSDDAGRERVSDPNSPDYYLEYDENWIAFVVFGDGNYGRRPRQGSNNVRASYRVGGGSTGNVAAGTITSARTQIRQLKAVTNRNPASGGVDAETIDHAVRFGPLAFRAGRRAVTLADYVALAQQAGGVAKVRAVSRGWNRIDLFVAPEGNAVTAAPPALKQKLVQFFGDKRMVGTFVFIEDPTPLPIRVDVEIWVEHNYASDLVVKAVRDSLQEMFSFANMDFNKTLYISKIYEAVEAVPGVSAANVSRFQVDRPIRKPRIVLEREAAFGKTLLIRPPELLQTQVPVDGRIMAGEFEIPFLNALNISVGGELREFL
jgi:hypothetical protein